MKDSGRRLFVSAAAAVLLVLLYCVIFGFSAQNAEESGSLSQYMSGKCADFLHSVSGSRWSAEVLRSIAEVIEHPLRKLAHFTEYGCMGILVYILLSQWMKRGKRLYLLTTAWLFLSAAGDELHQYFVPGRYASFRDVLLDTCGGICGMLFCVLVRALYVRRKKKAGRKTEPE